MDSDEEEASEPLLKPGDNCWRIERADRAAVLLTGEEYFRAVRHALLEAQEHVAILAWDMHSGILLERGEHDPEDGLPRELGPFLTALLERRSGLRIHILVWDYSVIYAAEREWRFLSDTFRNPHPRLDLRFDDRLPSGASHHQKVVVIDDALAFTGGFDLGTWRWDSAERRLHDERRTDPDGNPYPPFHDLQMAVSGPAAMALGDLCAERWKRAAGDELPRTGERRDQLRRLDGRAGAAHGAEPEEDTVRILMGDLNEWFPFGRAARILRDRFGPVKTVPTFPACFPLFALDRIHVTPPSVQVAKRTLESEAARKASDHLPLVAELTF